MWLLTGTLFPPVLGTTTKSSGGNFTTNAMPVLRVLSKATELHHEPELGFPFLPSINNSDSEAFVIA